MIKIILTLKFYVLVQYPAIPEPDNFIYWALGVLVIALGGALAYVKTQHSEQIKAKDLVIESLNKNIEYEREQKDKFKSDYDNLVKDFYSIFNNQNLLRKKD